MLVAQHLKATTMADHLYTQDRMEELDTLAAIYPELATNEDEPFSARLFLDVAPLTPLNVKFVSATSSLDTRDAALTNYSFSRLPPLEIKLVLPPGYPYDVPPNVQINTTPAWLPSAKLEQLIGQVPLLWTSAGQAQVVYDFIVFLEQEIESGFHLPMKDGVYELDSSFRLSLLDFSARAEKAHFDKQTFSCGVCISPKKGSACYRMRRCGHVFCKECIEGFYTSCITEGDINRVQCMATACQDDSTQGKIRKTIPPAELLQIPLPKALVQRYADLKRKKKMELDKTMSYCPRTWCQSPARSKKYPKITDLSQMTESDDMPDKGPPSADDAEESEKPTDDRLLVCENEECQFAFCKLCKRGWHGEFYRCDPVGPRDEAELSKEEQASEEYIRRNTSECPSCMCAVQKSRGCNHMTCFQCRGHLCYICGFWLDPENPYKHFNQKGKGCYNRLWDLQGGDEAEGEVEFAGARGWEEAVLDALGVPDDG